jgi:hypothetical protein
MGVRTRGLDIAINAKRQVADAASRAEAKAVIERWNEQLGRQPGHAVFANDPGRADRGNALDVFCAGCGTRRVIDLRNVDRHPLASVATLELRSQPRRIR